MTTADGTWQTRGWHSKNAARNYLNGALLYCHHLRVVVEGGLYPGTSKSAEGYSARVTFQRAKAEGMEVAIHWQDADSTSAKAVREVYPKAQIMTDRHTGTFWKSARKTRNCHKPRLRSAGILFQMFLTRNTNVRSTVVV